MSRRYPLYITRRSRSFILRFLLTFYHGFSVMSLQKNVSRRLPRLCRIDTFLSVMSSLYTSRAPCSAVMPTFSSVMFLTGISGIPLKNSARFAPVHVVLLMCMSLNAGVVSSTGAGATGAGTVSPRLFTVVRALLP